MANKLLNLDELSTDTKVIKLDGNEHPLKEMSVQEFIDRAKKARGEGAIVAPETLDEKTAAVVGMIDEAFPTIGKERLGRLSLPALNAILEFAFQTPAEIEAAVLAEQKSAEGNA